ncbi:MAG: DUF3604 domain-containing protein [Halioglobus sp.]|nr:DUF3604 domain-containing protein [Halioglobus sp.]
MKSAPRGLSDTGKPDGTCCGPLHQRLCRTVEPRTPAIATALVVTVCAMGIAPGAGADIVPDGDGFSVECDDYDQYRNAYFGDTHVHTVYSADAYIQGTDTTPDEAYQYAKGALLGLHPFDALGAPTRFSQIDRPLDFAVVTDHAEFLGEQHICLDELHPQYNTTECVALRDRDGNLLWNVPLGNTQDAVERFDWCEPGSICLAASVIPWQAIQAEAAAHYEPCTFSTFNGYEYSGAPLDNTGPVWEALNYHRNVIFRNSIVQAVPSAYLDEGYAERMWLDLRDECLELVDPGGECDVITIPHNSNLSQEKLFETVRPNGLPYNAAFARLRRQFEPLVEVFQHKGSSECLATVEDELCDFELIPWGHIAGDIDVPGFPIGPTTPEVEGTVRYALKEGLSLHNSLGINPFTYGMIGSSDTHLGTPGLVMETVDYPGHGGAAGTITEGITDTPEFNPGGLAVVWAEQNSRGALFDAMQRREVYATSGPRHVVRFFGGFSIPNDVCADPDPAVGYANGVPMGGLLVNAEGNNPRFFVHALKDPGSTGNALQQIQIIKGWVDELGATQEQVIDLTTVPGDGAVDLSNCAVSSTVGYAELCHYWEDTNFDPNERSFYYARVIENPSCRWTHRQCLAAVPPVNCAGAVPEEFAACCDAEIPKTQQERSWTSPIWYNTPPPGCM